MQFAYSCLLAFKIGVLICKDYLVEQKWKYLKLSEPQNLFSAIIQNPVEKSIFYFFVDVTRTVLISMQANKNATLAALYMTEIVHAEACGLLDHS